MKPPLSNWRMCAALFGLVFLTCSLLQAQPPVFTGDVEADFVGPCVVTITDGQDVNMGSQYGDAISGFDIKDLRLYYDWPTDTLYVGINTFGIAGDADGDGDPGGSSQALLNSLGVDLPDFGGSESFFVALGARGDGSYDIVVGVCARKDCVEPGGFRSAYPTQDCECPPFGHEVLEHVCCLFASPGVEHPDIEFTICNISALPGFTVIDGNFPLKLCAFMGSTVDDGIGEDYVFAGQIYLPVRGSIGDWVWEDLNGNGIQEEGEPPIPGVTLDLLDGFGNIVGTRTTGSEDGYYFCCLDPGDYTVVVTDVDHVLDGMALTTANEPYPYLLALGEHHLDADFGYIRAQPAPSVLVTKCYEKICPEPDPGPEASPGTGTPGYWKNHPDAWPVDEVEVGGVVFSKADAIALLTQKGGDKTLTLFRAYVAATLNVLIGNEDSCIAGELTAAAVWFDDNPVGSRVKGKSSAWNAGEELNTVLDAYNNGLLCAPSRDAVEAGSVAVSEPAEPCDPDRIEIGDVVRFTITVTASSPLGGDLIQVRDCLDSSLVVIETWPPAVVEGQSVLWDLELPAGASVTELVVDTVLVDVPSADPDACGGGDWLCSDYLEVPVIVEIPCVDEVPGTGTPGYWKNHPEAWPVDMIEIGGIEYARDEAIPLMTQKGGDKSLTLFRALVAAKLNVLAGNPWDCIAEALDDADDWLSSYPPGSYPRKCAWKKGEWLNTTLDAYNNGLLCAPSRDTLENQPEPEMCEAVMPLLNQACFRFVR